MLIRSRIVGLGSLMLCFRGFPKVILWGNPCKHATASLLVLNLVERCERLWFGRTTSAGSGALGHGYKGEGELRGVHAVGLKQGLVVGGASMLQYAILLVLSSTYYHSMLGPLGVVLGGNTLRLSVRLGGCCVVTSSGKLTSASLGLQLKDCTSWL
jgi:hypothetical protein